MRLTFNINQKQYDILLGLRSHMAYNAKCRERWPEDYEVERENIDKTICGLFSDADRNGIPFWVQNIVCGFQDDWRHALTTYLYQDLEKYGVNCSGVSCR